MAAIIESQELVSHLKLVAKYFLRGRVVLFLGAGANLCDRPDGFRWDPNNSEYLPNGSELAVALADEFEYGGRQSCPKGEECPLQLPQLDLANVSQYGDIMAGRGELYDALRPIFTKNYRGTSLHYLLARLPEVTHPTRPEHRHSLIVTTNYDDLMEQALEEARKSFDLVYYDPDEPSLRGFWHKAPDGAVRPVENPNNDIYPFCENRPTIVKIHGTIDRINKARESFVITEDHYLDYLAADPLNKLPVLLSARLQESHFLFLGYSLRDWNLRVFLRELIKQKQSKRFYQFWAILLSAEKAEQKFWTKNGVDVLAMPLSDYVNGLRRELGL